jgi:hypothetical protein
MNKEKKSVKERKRGKKKRKKGKLGRIQYLSICTSFMFELL